MKRMSVLFISDDGLACWNIEIIDKLLDKYADVICVDANNINGITNLDLFDLIIILTNKIYRELMCNFSANDNIIVIKPTISENVYEQILSVKNDNIKLASNNKEYADEIGKLINSISASHENIDIINVENTAEDGTSEPAIECIKLYISFATIVEIIIKANIFFLIDDLILSTYAGQIYNCDENLENIYNIAKKLKIRQASITSFMRRSLIEIDKELNILTINNIVEKLLKTQAKDIINTSFDKWFPDFGMDKVMEKGVLLKDRMVIFEGNNYFLSVHMTKDEEKNVIGANVVIEGLEDVQDIYRALRRHMFSQGYIAKYTIDNMIGKSSAMENLKKIVRSMALSDSSVLITGETGTGKEIVAQALHNLSSRKDKPFIAINCIALPEALLESELFGYEEGAFTGAKKGGKLGVFELASGGTVFLDEIGKMPISLQGKLLRVIQEREIMHVGGSKIINIDIRLIAATNKNIKNLIEENMFISDLYYRINVLPIYILPIRDRVEDIDVLIKYYTQVNGYKFKLSKEAQKKIDEYKWPGNVREIINCLEYFDNLRKKIIEEDDLPVYILNEYTEKNKAICENEGLDLSVLSIYNNDEVMINLCRVLLESYENLERIGRSKIVKKMTENGIFVTEQRIRKYIDFLRNNTIVIVHNKGGGTQLTLKGKGITENWLIRLNKQPNLF